MSILLEIRRHIINYFEINHKSVSIVIGMCLILLISYVDYQISLDISLAIFYLLPVFLLTWFVNQETGFLTAIFSAITWYITNPIRQPTKSAFFVHYWNAIVISIFLLTTSFLLFELRKARIQEKESARIDSTTGVANKRLFFELAELEIKKVNRYRHPITIIYIDIDNFKTFNEAQGNSVGDKLLQIVAKTIKNSIRDTDIVARIEGDEFVIILPGSGYEPAHIVICRLQKELLATMQNNEWVITFSIGAATFINPPTSVEEMLQRVDHLIYLAKTNGKNQLKHITSV